MNFNELLEEYETRFGIADLESWNTEHLIALGKLVDEELAARMEGYPLED